MVVLQTKRVSSMISENDSQEKIGRLKLHSSDYKYVVAAVTSRMRAKLRELFVGNSQTKWHRHNKTRQYLARRESRNVVDYLSLRLPLNPNPGCATAWVFPSRPSRFMWDTII